MDNEAVRVTFVETFEAVGNIKCFGVSFFKGFAPPLRLFASVLLQSVGSWIRVPIHAGSCRLLMPVFFVRPEKQPKALTPAWRKLRSRTVSHVRLFAKVHVDNFRKPNLFDVPKV